MGKMWQSALVVTETCIVNGHIMLQLHGVCPTENLRGCPVSAAQVYPKSAEDLLILNAVVSYAEIERAFQCQRQDTTSSD